MWETKLLDRVDYFKTLLNEGLVIKRSDVEMADLRFFRRTLKGTLRPQIQVYKRGWGNKEVNKIFYNYNEALDCFDKLVKGNYDENRRELRTDQD